MPWQQMVADVGGELVVDEETGLLIPAYRDVVFTTPRQSGKDLSCATPILTTAGWKTMGSVQVGDKVYGPDGRPTKVTFTSEVFLGNPCYEVEFTDGAVIVAGEDHLWWVQDIYGSRTSTRGWRVKSTADIARSTWGTARANGRMGYRYRVKCDTVPLTPAADLPVDPYIFGYWLGDGYSAGAMFAIGDQDRAAFVAQVDNAGYFARGQRRDPRTGVWAVSVSTRPDRAQRGQDCLRARLRLLGVLGNKHIPEQYLTASVDQRRALLAGLLDSDGTIQVVTKSPRVALTCMSKQLAVDAQRLARSLGARSTLREGRAQLNGRMMGPKYEVAWTPTFNPFRLRRKAERFQPPASRRQELMSIVGIREVPSVPTRCIQVAHPDHVFLVGEQFTPTHNTTEILAWEGQRAIGWEHLGPQRISYSAQTGADARKKLIQDQKPLLEPVKKALGIKRIYEAIGSEGVLWHNGSRLVLLNNTEASGHGPSVDLGIKDELFADIDDRRDQALVPSMATKAAGQVVSASTMGTEDSLPWNELVARGRAAVEAGLRRGIAYFEYSLPDGADINDPEVWWTFMPALGFTITVATVINARDKMKANEFLRAFGNRKTKADDRVIPETDWSTVCSPAAAPAGKPVFSLDMNPERSAGAITAASPGVGELLEYRLTTTWLVDRAKEISEKWGKPLWVVHRAGPAGSLIGDMERAGLRVHAATEDELVKACGDLYTGIVEHTVAIRQHQRLDEAAAGVAKRFVGDAFAWTRKNAAADICPLMGITLALWGAENLADSKPTLHAWGDDDEELAAMIAEYEAEEDADDDSP